MYKQKQTVSTFPMEINCIYTRGCINRNKHMFNNYSQDQYNSSCKLEKEEIIEENTQLCDEVNLQKLESFSHKHKQIVGMYQRHINNIKNYPNTRQPALKALGPKQQHMTDQINSDEQIASILFSESQYSNKKPSRNKVYQTPEKKYEQLAAKKQPLIQQQNLSNTSQNNKIFSFNQQQGLDESGQSTGEYKWNMPTRQNNNNSQNKTFIQNNNNNLMNQQQYQEYLEQPSLSHQEEQHSYIPSDNSSNLFDSMKSLSYSFNQAGDYTQKQNTYNNNQQQLQMQRQAMNQHNYYNTNNNNYIQNMNKANIINNNQNLEQQRSLQSLNQGFACMSSSTEEQLDSTDQIINIMRADLLEVDSQTQQITPNYSVGDVYGQEREEQENNRMSKEYLYTDKPVYQISNQNGYLYPQSYPLSPSENEPIELNDKSKRQSFNDISNQQIPIKQAQQQIQQQQQTSKQSNNLIPHHLSKQEYRNNEGQNDTHQSSSSQTKKKEKKDDPIVRDIIKNIQASKQYLSNSSQKQQKQDFKQKECKKQMHIYESILDENNSRKKYLNTTFDQPQTQSSALQYKQKHKPYTSVAILDSISKKRSASLQNSGQKKSVSPKRLLRYNASCSFINSSPGLNNNKSSIESKLSLLKDLTQRHIQTMPLSSHLSSLKKQNNSNYPRSGFEVCTYLKDPSGKSLIKPLSKEQILLENRQTAAFKASDNKSHRVRLDLSETKDIELKQKQLQNQLDNKIQELNEEQKKVSDEIIQVDQKVNRLEIKNKKLKQKWKDQGINQQLITEEETHLQNMSNYQHSFHQNIPFLFNNLIVSQEQKNQYIISELNRCNNEMQAQLEQVLKQIELEKLEKQQPQSGVKKEKTQQLQSNPQVNQIKTLQNINSLNNTLSLPSSPYTFIGGSFSVKNQLLSNNNINTQFLSNKSDNSMNNIIGNSFDQQDQMISHLIQKYSPSPKNNHNNNDATNNNDHFPTSFSQTINSSNNIQNSDTKKLPQNSTQYRSILQSRGLHDIMEEPSCEDSKNSFLPLTHYKKQ